MSLHEKTPLIRSGKLSALAGRDVLLKLDNLQPPGSFKIRGIGHLVQQGVASGATSAVSSSGGNAGMAAAYAAKQAGIECTVIVPQSTPQSAIDNIKELGATVEVHGEHWNIADQEARARIKDKTVLYINPFDHPLIWDGHATLIDELKEDMKTKPSLIICSVGGGGLLLGILRGLKRNKWDDVPVLAMETHGAESLNEAMKQGKLITLDGIKSIAKSLGSTRVAEEVPVAIDAYGGKVHSRLCTDMESIEAVESFLADHRFFVEPACGASLAAIYSSLIHDVELGDGPIVIEVCGGSAVSLELIDTWKQNAYKPGL